MGKVTVTGDVIWLDAIEQDAPLQDRLQGMTPGQIIDLEVSGVVRPWQRLDAVRNGVLVAGIRPLHADEYPWSTLLAEGGVLFIGPVGPNETRLATFEEQLHRWDIAENRIYT